MDNKTNKPTYEQLEAQVKQLVAENALLRTPLLHWNAEKLEMEYGTLPETPATDAYLSQLRNEARAEGVESLSSFLWLRANEMVREGSNKKMVITTRAAARLADDYAQQLREGDGEASV